MEVRAPWTTVTDFVEVVKITSEKDGDRQSCLTPIRGR